MSEIQKRKNKKRICNYQWKALSKRQQINNDVWNLNGLQAVGDGKLF